MTQYPTNEEARAMTIARTPRAGFTYHDRVSRYTRKEMSLREIIDYARAVEAVNNVSRSEAIQAAFISGCVGRIWRERRAFDAYQRIAAKHRKDD